MKMPHVEVWALNYGRGAEAEAAMAGGAGWTELKKSYSLYDKAPASEFLDNMAETAMWFMERSRSSAYRSRQMRPLQHLDLLRAGGLTYVLWDAAMPCRIRGRTARLNKMNYNLVEI